MSRKPEFAEPVREALMDVLGIGRAAIALEAEDMIAGGLIDSFALIEFAARLEERLDLAIPTEALNEDNFRSHASVAAMIESLKGAQEC